MSLQKRRRRAAVAGTVSERRHRWPRTQVGLQRVLDAAGEQLVTVFNCWEEPPAYRAWVAILGAAAALRLGVWAAAALRGGRSTPGFSKHGISGKLF